MNNTFVLEVFKYNHSVLFSSLSLASALSPPALLANGYRVRTRIPERHGHGVAHQEGGAEEVRAGGAMRKGEHLPAAATDHARESDVLHQGLHHRPQGVFHIGLKLQTNTTYVCTCR